MGEKFVGLERFAMHLVEARDAVIPFEQRGGAAGAFAGVRVHFPHGVEHRVIVRVENVALVLRVPGDVHLRHALGRHGVEVFVGVEAVVLRGHVDVVHIEQNPAVRALDHLAEKLPLRHFGDVELDVAAHVFDRDGDLQKVLHFADIARGGFHGFPRVGHGQKVVRVAAVHAAPAEVIADPRRLRALGQALEFAEVVAVRARGVAEVHRDPVLDHAVLLEDLVEDVERAARIEHVVFGNDLEPIDERLFLQDVRVMGDAQAEADAVFGVGVEAVGRHVGKIRNPNIEIRNKFKRAVSRK